MSDYIHIKDERSVGATGFAAVKKSIKRCLGADMISGAISSLKVMFSKPVTRFYPYQKVELDNRYRAVHRLMRFVESGNERCIGCGLCEKICISNCIRMQTTLGSDGRKKVENYSINLGRCIYCGFCADVCPELAIVHGTNFENAAQQRSYYAHKKDILTPLDKLKEQVEFEGAGSLRKDADSFVKKTPNYYEIDLRAQQAAEQAAEMAEKAAAEQAAATNEISLDDADKAQTSVINSDKTAAAAATNEISFDSTKDDAKQSTKESANV